MISRIKSTFWMLLCSSLCCLSSQAIAQEVSDGTADAIEEILVTGTFIKRGSFDEVGSPVTTLSGENIAMDAPAAKISDFSRYLTFNYGSSSTLQGGEDASDIGGGTFDLRGLGQASTLVLLNGRRHVRSGISQSGIVNVNSLTPVIMIDRVEILKDGASAIYGTDAVAGVVNVLTRDTFTGLELQTDIRGTTNSWDHSTYTASFIAGSEVGEGRTNIVAAAQISYTDPLKYTERSSEFPFLSAASSSFGNPGNYSVPSRDANGVLDGTRSVTPDPNCEDATSAVLVGGRCRYDFLRNFVIAREEERINGMVRLTQDISDNVTFFGELAFTDADITSTGTPSRPVLNLPTVPGENPGNPFRAVDANGAPLFALDANNDGIADRDAGGTVILSGDPTNPASGVAFNEDVLAFFRPLGDGNGAAGGNAIDQLNEETTFRAVGGFNGEISENWSFDVAAVWAKQKFLQRLPDSFSNEMIAALNGQGGLGGNQYLNPFANSLSAQPGDANYNDPQVLSRILTLETDQFDTELLTVDAVVSGSLGSTLAGPIGVAFGAQYRDESLAIDFSSANTAGLLTFNGFFDQDFDASEDVVAVFGEILVPLVESEQHSLELSAAVRYEETNSNLDSTDPKVSLLYNYSDWLTLRGSFSTSFLAPSIFQRLGSQSGLQSFNDPVTGATDFRAVFTAGNPALEPQESDNISFGVSVRPLENLSLTLDYWDFQFENLLAVPSAAAIVAADPFDPRITRDPVTNEIVFVEANFFNASSVDANGFDFGANYLWSTDRGDIELDLQASYFATYDLFRNPGDDAIDGVGNANDNNFGSAIPEWKSNFRTSWQTGAHAVHGTIRYTSEVFSQRRNDTADAQTYLDLQYVYDWESFGSALTVGALNAFDDLPNVINDNNAYLDTIQDPIGRVIYVTLNKSF